MKYEFGPDAFRDNEYERRKTAEAIERLEMGDNIEDLEIEELERIVAAAKAEGSNKAAVLAGRLADNELDRQAEAAWERQIESYYGGGGTVDRQQDQLRDAGRLR